MLGRRWLGLLVVLPLVLGARVASAQVSKSEEKCQQAAAVALGKLATARAKCIVKCDQSRQKGAAVDCRPGLADTKACLDTAVAKAGAAIDNKCATSCPSCLGGGDCSGFRTSRIARAVSILDGEYPVVFCSTPMITSAEAKCRQTAAVEATKFVASLAKCYAKCHLLEVLGLPPPKGVFYGSCAAPNPSDAKTAACKAAAISKANKNIAAKCTDAPACLMATLPMLVQPTAANLAEDFDCIEMCDPTVNTGGPKPASCSTCADRRIFCFSPSGAFLDPLAN